MFKSFYALNKEPFPKNTKVKDCFVSKDFNQAMDRLNFLKDSKGFGLLIGEPGVGKSFVLRSFVDSFKLQSFQTCLYCSFYSYCDGLLPGFS